MKKIKVETSARHVHISKKDLAILFGDDACLKVKKYLSVDTEYVCEQKVDIVGPKNTMKQVSILGPERSKTQVEISLTDARALGVVAPIRLSGDLKDSGVCTLVGPKGSLVLSEGVIIAKRHIHTNPDDAKALGVQDKEVVWVKIDSEDRSFILGDVVIRVKEDLPTTMHIDTDEANAGNLKGEVWGEIVKV